MGSMAGVTAFLLFILAVAPAYATDYTVGDTSGWTSGSDYSTWASDKTFNVGDTLLFSYSTMLHSVSEVSKSDYDACSATNSVQTYSDGSTTIKLTAPGNRYFICGSVGHCSAGMKLAVDVASGSGSTDSPPSTGSGSTDTPSTGSGSGSGSGTSDAPSPGSGSTDTPPTGSGSGTSDAPSTGSGSTDTPSTGSGSGSGSGTSDAPSTGSGTTDTPPTGSGSGTGTTDAPPTGSGSTDTPSTGSGSDDSPSAGSGSGDAPDAGSGNDSPSSGTPAKTPGSSVSNVPYTHSTTTPSGKTTPATSINAAAGSSFRDAGGVMVAVTALVGVALMG